MTDIPTISALPDAPQRGQDAAVFIQRADAFIDALSAFVAEMNTFGEQLIDATAERVVDEAAASYAGATAAKNAALAARDAAQGYAATVNPANLVHQTGDEGVDGIKTFAKKIIATLGIRINGQDLAGLTAAGKALVEAADVAAQKTLLGVGAVPALGAVGSYIVAASTALPTGLNEPGATVAGSSLTVGAQSNGNPIALSGETPNLQAYSNDRVSLGFSGTWRLLSRVSQATSFAYSALWVRIS